MKTRTVFFVSLPVFLLALLWFYTTHRGMNPKSGEKTKQLADGGRARSNTEATATLKSGVRSEAKVRPSLSKQRLEPGVLAESDDVGPPALAIEMSAIAIQLPVPEPYLTEQALYADDPVAQYDLQQTLAVSTETVAAQDACLGEWVRERGGDIHKYYGWRLLLRMVSDGKQGRFVEASSDNWPKAFDRKLRDCYLRSVTSRTFATDHSYDHQVVFNMGLRGNLRQ